MDLWAKRLLRTFFALSVWMVGPAGGEPATGPAGPVPATRPSGNATTRPGQRRRAPQRNQQAAQAAGLSKREWKEQKWKRKVEEGKRREEKVEQHIVELQRSGKGSRAATRPVVANPRQYAEDFDWGVDWEQKGNRGAYAGTDYGYSGANHLSAAGCAPGEIGGPVAGGAVSWFADDVARGRAPLGVEIALSASGWCMIAAGGGATGVGWFDASTYVESDATPHAFLGWRQDGESIRAALGVGGASLVDGAPVSVGAGRPFHWKLVYTPDGGDDGCGQIMLSVADSWSKLSLTRAQRDALAKHGFDRFGILGFKGAAGDGTIWLDDLVYTRMGGFPVPHPAAAARTRTAFFDTDPTGDTWFGVNNRPTAQPVLVTQNYGYQPASKGIGRTAGCIGGSFMRAIGASYYGYDYGEKKLHYTDNLRSEGYVQLPSSEGQGFRMGWTTKKALSWREPSTLALRFGFNKGKITVWVDFNTKSGEGKGGGTWEPVATVKAGPQWHHYVLEYDPAGTGTVSARFDDATATYKLKYGIKDLDADIDLFGVWNPKIPAFGQATVAFVDDIVNTVNGERCPSSSNFESPPAGWVGVNNAFRNKKDYIVRPFHNFGWVKGLPHLDGSNADDSPMYVMREDDQRYCAGGPIWLATWDDPKNRACYGADLGGMLNARDHHVFVTGRIKLDFANVDAGELFGWYNSATATDAEAAGKGHTMPDKFLGIKIDGGASYFAMPCYRSPNLREEYACSANAFIPEPVRFEYPPQPPRLYHDGRWREFYMEYDPEAAGGRGRITVQIGEDGVPFTFDLKSGAKGENFNFDRFGLLTERKGGGKHHAVYFDKLTYTVAR